LSGAKFALSKFSPADQTNFALSKLSPPADQRSNRSFEGNFLSTVNNGSDRVTGCVGEKMAQDVAQFLILPRLAHELCRVKKQPTILTTFEIFKQTAQSKH
jgi:hypothetical protein